MGVTETVLQNVCPIPVQSMTSPDSSSGVHKTGLGMESVINGQIIIPSAERVRTILTTTALKVAYLLCITILHTATSSSPTHQQERLWDCRQYPAASVRPEGGELLNSEFPTARVRQAKPREFHTRWTLSEHWSIDSCALVLTALCLFLMHKRGDVSSLPKSKVAIHCSGLKAVYEGKKNNLCTVTRKR